ncbi:hypothetical protein J1N35_035556 [Gossypium stocksii]|uniref:Uncharacterized protein n=1 Tax=Gossypium stocksii TaxID=47602 RepID=A0A9D3UUH8_9ROSI|nr:hypothetical protein J1N35_035556 [Gossypium stocksii]
MIEELCNTEQEIQVLVKVRGSGKHMSEYQDVLKREEDLWVMNSKTNKMQISSLFESTTLGWVLLSGVDRRTSNEPIRGEEINRAVFSSNPYEASGPDGLHPFIFQKCWVTVKEKVCDMVIDVIKT